MKTCAISVGLPVLLAIGGCIVTAGLDHHQPRDGRGSGVSPVAAAEAPDDSAAEASSPPSGKRAKYEPAQGVYLGAALDYSHLEPTGTGAHKYATVMRDWEKLSARKHAIYSQFLPFPHDDGKFPAWDSDPNGWNTASDFCDATTAVGATPMLTLEPQQPLPFADNWQPGSPTYDATAAFARAVGTWGRPIFIRFAHEMNGSWYPWAEWIDKNRNMQRDPGEDTGFTAARYRVAFRHVASLFKKYAPNAALVWCPNSGLLSGARRDVFRPFYPGDDVVDWVGLDIYERGWTMPMPGAHLWGGQFGHNLDFDANDDPATPANESTDFYKFFAEGRHKPLMICETGATLSYRNDLPEPDRALLNHQWKSGFWNTHEYGWMQGVYGTSHYRRQAILQPIDRTFPMIKAIVWFQVAKNEYIPAEKQTGDKREIVWFDNQWADYRVGGGIAENQAGEFAEKELQIYRDLTANPWFLSTVK